MTRFVLPIDYAREHELFLTMQNIPGTLGRLATGLRGKKRQDSAIRVGLAGGVDRSVRGSA